MEEGMERPDDYIKGRGAQLNTFNPYKAQEIVEEHIEGLDEKLELARSTQFFTEYPKEIVNKVTSPDVGMMYSSNPYQGCEHGCIYCYARNSHQYWGFSAGMDFEQKIIVKPDAPILLEKKLQSKSWEGGVISLSGNTDCYQPVERKMKITRRMLEILLEYGNPVGIITKNQLILRDLDILTELAKKRLVHVMQSITSVHEDLRLKMEPRTASYAARFKTMEALSKAGIPVGVMAAPIVPGLNSKDIPDIIKRAADCGAVGAGYTIVRLNGSIGEIFTDWIKKSFPDRAQKVLHAIEQCHNGKLNDSRWGNRMKGDGAVAGAIKQLFKMSVSKHLAGRSFPDYDFTLYRKDPGAPQQGMLF